MDSAKRNYYEIIGLTPYASHADIDAACVALAQRHQAGLYTGAAGAEDDFRQIEKIYETLGNPAAREAYDLSLKAPAEELPPVHEVSQSTASDDAVSLRFTGQAGEYFRIWIVNVCLSILTLGIYSAWAKVRRKRYFYGSTLLKNTAFEYLADPKAILKGRLIVVGVLFIFWLIAQVTKANFLGLLYLAALPYVVIKAARFNAINSAFRTVRFRFGIGFKPQTGFLSKHYIDGYNQTSQFLILPVVLVPLTLGLIYPYYSFRKRQFLLEHSAYGTTPFTFDARAGAYYFAYFKAMLLFMLFLVGTVVTIGIAALPLYILFAAYRDAAIGRLNWDHTSLGTLRFHCNWKTWDLLKLHLVNSLAIIFTLGLMAPWAAIRVARYELQGLALTPAAAIDGFAAMMQEQVTATGDEAGELLGFDFGL